MSDHRTWTWSYWVVPTADLKREIRKHVKQLKSDNGLTRWGGDTEDVGWRELLATRCELRGFSRQSVLRRLYKIENEQTLVTNADFADVVLLSVGVNIGLTRVKTYPGNMKQARERVLVKADLRGESLSEEQVESRARAIIRLRNRVLEQRITAGYIEFCRRERDRRQRDDKKRRKDFMP